MTVEKKLPDAITSLEERNKKLKESFSNIQKTIGELAMRMSHLQKEAEKYMGPMA